MGFFSGIGKAVGGLVSKGAGMVGSLVGGGWGDAISAVGQFGGDLLSQGADNSAVQQNNAFNANQALLNRDFQSNEAFKTRDFNQQMARESMDWQNQQSSTAYQRATKDMMAAGINPMLAVSQGGAATTGGATASGPMPGGSAASATQTRFPTDSMVSAAMARNRQADVDRIKADTKAKEAQADNIKADTNVLLAREPNVREDTALKNEQGHVARQEARRLYDTIDLIASQVAQNLASASQTRTQTKILTQDLPRAINEGDFHRSPAGRAVPYNKALQDVLTTAGKIITKGK